MKAGDRKIVFDKCGGRCAYCGCELNGKWHVDHIDPIIRKTKTIPQHWQHKETKEKIQLHEFKRLQEMESEEYRKWEYMQPKQVPDGCHKPENDTIENMLPACISCNIYKHSADLETFRFMLTHGIESLNKNSTQYKFAKKYGLVSETGKQVKFYFETIE